MDIGFIGLGIMGKPMVRNLMKDGHSITVFDVVATSIEEMVGDGAKAASSSREIAENNSLVITMVPDSADSEAAIMGPGGVLEGASSGSAVIDMSSIAPGSSQKIAAACEAAGVDFLDAPVSGGEPGEISVHLNNNYLGTGQFGLYIISPVAEFREGTSTKLVCSNNPYYNEKDPNCLRKFII